MKTIIAILLILLCVLASCTKETVAQPVQQPKKGTPAWLISYKYNLDTVLQRKPDTLWFDLNLADKELVKIKAEPAVSWMLFCDPPIAALPGFLLEKRVYVIGKK